MISYRILNTVCTLVFCFNISFAQDLSKKNLSQEYILTSEQGHEYTIKVQLPINYKDSIEYPVLYYLDAWWLENSVTGAYRLLQGSRKVRSAILVGISGSGNEYEFNVQRTRDYTPTPYDLKKVGMPMVVFSQPKIFEITERNSGDASLFTSFLTGKVFPLIHKNYRIDAKNKGFLGHSLGGLYGIQNLSLEEPIFDNYIVISPAIWWNGDTNYYQPLKENLADLESTKKLFMCYGTAEDRPIVVWTDKLNTFLNSQDLVTKHYKFVTYNGEDHTSVLPEAIYEGLEFLFGFERR